MIGKILISEPFLNDPNFVRSVILIVEHNEEGTVGFVLNNKLDFTVDLVMKPLDFKQEPVFQGGPVELDSFHFLHNHSNVNGCIEILSGVYWGGDFEDLVEQCKLNPNQNTKFIIGYSGWAVGQLENEIEQDAWLVSEIDAEAIFNQTDDKSIWKNAINNLGGADSLLSNSPPEPWLN